MDNAIKYSKARSKIYVTSKVTKGIVFIKIIDNGIGITEDDIERIFDRFYRVDKSRGSSFAKGFGLGLSIAKEIVHLHKGEIRAVSSQKGTEFIVELPLA